MVCLTVGLAILDYSKKKRKSKANFKGDPKVSLGLAMSYHSMPCGRPPLEKVVRLFQGGWPAAVLLLP
jgi:hypothetical protein